MQQSFQKPYSEELGNRMDQEVRKIIEDAYARAKEILQEDRNSLEEIAGLLLENEVIFNKDVRKVMEEKEQTHA
jgi:cell division protease FtsH